jgi:hypothetical protein
MWLALLLLASTSEVPTCPFSIVTARSQYSTASSLEIGTAPPSGLKIHQRVERRGILLERTPPIDAACWRVETVHLRPGEVEAPRDLRNLGVSSSSVLLHVEGAEFVLPAGTYRACAEFLVHTIAWRKWDVWRVCSASFEVLEPSRYTRFK